MKQFSVVLIVLSVYSFSLFSCVGVHPTANSNKESQITVQDSAVASPLQPNVVVQHQG